MTERPTGIFSDVHAEDGKVRATLLHDPTVEGLDTAIYVDGSGSMADEYGRPGLLSRFFHWLVGKSAPSGKNIVEPQIHRMLEYLASKDRNGSLRVAYWATGENGNNVEPLGELSGANADTYEFNGPRHEGGGTRLGPAIADFVSYMKDAVKKGARQGCAVIVTDGQIHDADTVEKLSRDIAADIGKGRLPRMNFVLVGVGDQIDEHQMEEIAHIEHPGIGHLWCHRVAAEMKELPELVAVLVDETMTVAAGGTIYDDDGNVLKVYEGRLPAVLEFEIADHAKSFILEVNGQRFEQPLPDEREHHDEDEDGDHH